MKLTLDEFNSIRPLQWTLKNIGINTYYTLINQTETQLFWLDFIKNIFASKFQRQQGITNISTFDITQPVLIDDDLNIILPTQLETVCYLANNQKPLPVTFTLPVSQLLILIVAGLVYVLVLILSIIKPINKHLI